MRSRTGLFLWLWAFLLAVSPVAAQTIINPSFEDGLYGWTAYSYTPAEGTNPVEPTVGCTDIGCVFDLLYPGTPPDGSYVCGIQASESTGNGGVYQTFVWDGGPSAITVRARNYAESYLGEPYLNRVRLGLVSGYSSNREDVTDWVEFPNSSEWVDRSVPIPDSGTYTLFIEAYQPAVEGDKSTLWDYVRVGYALAITDGPTVTPDPSDPESSAIVTWTTNAPCNSRVDYGPSASYGSSQEDSTLVTFHTVTITGLSNSSTYHYRVGGTSGEMSVHSADGTFDTPIQMLDLNVSVSPDNSTAYVTWQTDAPTDAQVEYWTDPEPHQIVYDTSPMGTSHQVILSLVEGKEYRFIATSTGTWPYTSVSSTGKFYTLPPPGNSLTNGSFEDTSGGVHSLYPWVQYTTDVGVPSYQPINGLIGPYASDGVDAWNPVGSSVGIRAYNGSYFLGTAAAMSYKNGGVFQRINVMPSQYYTLSARFITYRWGGGDGYNTVRIGVDPNGGIDPKAGTVQWRSVFSDTNNNLWHTVSLNMLAGPGGVATVFVDFHQVYSIQFHIAAVDAVDFSPPAPVSIGTLKASQSNLGAILDGKVVTYASAAPVWYGSTQYRKAYVEEEDRSAGVAVLMPLGRPEYPLAGQKITATGALAEFNKEAALLADVFTIDPGPINPGTGLPEPYELPGPLALSQSNIGTTAINQPPMFSHNVGLCTIGLRVRIRGRVTWVSSPGSPADVTAYVDDGGGIADGSGHAGVRVYLPGKGGAGLYVGDYVAATGVLGVELINPDNWPDPTDFYAYSLFVNTSADWMSIAGS